MARESTARSFVGTSSFQPRETFEAQAADVRASGGGRRRERERGKIKEKEGKGRSTRIAFTRHEKQPEGEAKVAGN